MNSLARENYNSIIVHVPAKVSIIENAANFIAAKCLASIHFLDTEDRMSEWGFSWYTFPLTVTTFVCTHTFSSLLASVAVVALPTHNLM